jgi:Zn-ribbon-containing, possibly RNA-binding protein and truncated derivatives
MGRRLKPPLPLKEVLHKALDQLDLAVTFRRHEAADRWPEIVGEKIASKSRPKIFQGDVLVVEVDHPAWVTELNLLKPQILKKMRLNHPRSGIRNLRFVLK